MAWPFSSRLIAARRTRGSGSLRARVSKTSCSDESSSCRPARRSSGSVCFHLGRGRNRSRKAIRQGVGLVLLVYSDGGPGVSLGEALSGQLSAAISSDVDILTIGKAEPYRQSS